MEAKEILTGLLVKAYKMTTDEVTALLEKADGNPLDEILEKDKAKISKLSTDKFQEGYKKSKAETLGEFEQNLISKYEVEDNTLKGDALIESIVTKKIEEAKPAKATGTKGEITEDDIKKHPLYISLEKAKTEAVEAKETEWKTKFDTKVAEYEKDAQFNSVNDHALDILAKEFVLPEDATIAKNQTKWFSDSLKNGYEFDKQDDGTWVISKEGKRLEDAHGNLLGMNEFVKQQGSQFFPLVSNNGGSNAGNEGGGANGGASGKVAIPKTQTEMMALANDKTVPLEQRQEAIKAYREANE